MKNEIDLSKYPIRSDLAIESILADTKIDVYKKGENIKVSTLEVTEDMEEDIGKKKGLYVTIEFDDITDFDNREEVGKVLENEIKKMLTYLDIKEDAPVLIVGLGNEKSTPDALGPITINDVLVTRHLFTLKTNVKKGIRSVAAINPGVMGTTGIETASLIKNVIDVVKPELLITIDALAASSTFRIARTIQMTDSGIHPGSGIGNSRQEISKNTLGIPVIAIGVPTVVSSTTIVSDTITYLLKHLAYIKDNYAKNKLVVSHDENYLERLQKKELTEEEKKEVIGLIGTLNEEDKVSLIREVLSSINYDMIVTPKEIDYLILKLGNLIASSLNNALHKEVSHY